MRKGIIMKKGIVLLVCFILFGVQAVSAQDYQATADALQLQIQIAEMQATLDALTGSSNGSPSGTGGNVDDGMYTWNQNNSGYYSTPTPFNYTGGYSGGMITNSNFPIQVRPPIPTGPAPTWQIPYNRFVTEVTVGDAGQYPTIADALNKLPSNAGAVTIYMESDTEEPQTVSIPLGKNITSVRIASRNGSARTIWPGSRSIWFFCNGIPLVLDTGITMAKTSMIMGGFVTYQGHNVEAPKSTIIINGNAYWVYAGGQSDREGHSSTVNDALVIVNGKVNRVYAGGRSIWGETFVHNSTIVVNGTADEIYCGGYTENAAAKATVGRADLKVYGWWRTLGLGLGAGQSYLLNPVGCYQ